MKRILSVLIATMLLVILIPLTLTVSASGSCGTAATGLVGTNVSGSHIYTRTARTKSFMEYLEDGQLMTVNYLSDEHRVEISYYTTAFKLKKTLSVTPEMPIWGGFYASGDYYYLFTGQQNREESPDVEVIRVTKYDKNWKRVAAVGLYDVNIWQPFTSGQVRCATADNVILVHTARNIYPDAGGVLHQTNFSFSFDWEKMTVIEAKDGLGNNHVSHSFDQYAYYDGEKFVTVDHGDGSPRAVLLQEYYPASFKVANKVDTTRKTRFLSMRGELGDNDTGISTGGFAVTSTSYILVGNTRWDVDEWYRSCPYNVFVAVIDRATYEVTSYRLTDYPGVNAYTPHIVKISDNSLLVLWRVDGTVYYQKINGKGEPQGKIYTMEGELSSVPPKVINGKVTWYAYSYDVVSFYTIPTDNLSKPAVKYVDNGHRYIYKGTATQHWKYCQDCKQTTPKENHSSSTYVTFSADETRDTRCKVCDLNVKSEKITTTLTESFDEKGNQKLKITLKTPTKTLKEGTDYKVSRQSSSFVDNGKLYLAVGNYIFTSIGTKKGSYSKSFTNVAFKATATAIADQSYTGKAITPSVTVKVGSKTLKKGTDYTISYSNNTKPGAGVVTIKGKGNYFGTLTTTFKIRRSIAKATVSGIVSKPYTGASVTQSPKIVLGGKTLKKNTDYTLSYKNNIKAGTATLTIKGKGNYKGTVTKTFKVTPQKSSKFSVSLSSNFLRYTGKALKPTVTVRNTKSKVLTKGTDYTVTYKNNVNAGTATATVKFKGNYSGTKTLKYTIAAESVYSCNVYLSKTEYTYTGKTITPTVVVKNKAGKTLKKNVDYTVTYDKGRKNVGEYKVTVKMKKNHVGSKTLSFTILPKTTSATKATGGKGQITVKVKAVSGVSGYEAQVGSYPDVTYGAIVTNTGAKNTTLKLQALRSGVTYYYRVRTYIKVGWKKVYSKWSTVKSCKAK